MKISVDWAHTKKKRAIYDGQTFHEDLPDLGEGDLIISENIPHRYAEPLLENDVEIQTCQPGALEDIRGLIPKTDKNDAMLLWDLYNNQPDKFRKLSERPSLTSMYNTYWEIQKTRIAQNNRAWAKDSELMDNTVDMLQEIEDMYVDRMEEELKSYPIFTEWLSNIKGISVKLGAGLVGLTAKNGIQNFKYPSALRHYAGLHVKNGKAASHSKGEQSSYVPEFKALLLGRIADSFIKQRTAPYREVYDSEKKKQIRRMELKDEGREDDYSGSAPESQGHAHNRARRKMMQIFLNHLWVVWRQLKGLETKPPYVHDKLKHDNYIKPPEIPDALKPFKPWEDYQEAEQALVI